jgi:hypothetical protein
MSVGPWKSAGRFMRISPEVFRVSSIGARHENALTLRGCSRPSVTRGWPTRASNSCVSSARSRMRPPGVSSPASSSALSSRRVSSGEIAKGCFIGSPLIGPRPRCHSASNRTMTLPRAMRAAKSVGRLTKNSTGRPFAERLNFGPGGGSGSRSGRRGAGLPIPGGKGVAVSPLRRGVAVAAGRRADFPCCRWRRPTATECAQMIPASREERQVQRLSMSTDPLMTRPAR